MAYLFQKKYRNKNGTAKKCRKWTIRYYNRQGQQIETPGYRDKKATEAKALKLELEAEREEAGIHDPLEEHRYTAVSQHLADFKERLERKGRPAEYVTLKIMRATKLLAKCKRLTDITEDRILDALKTVPGGAQTRNHYLQAVKQFVKWAVPKRLKENPLTGLQGENVRVDPDRKIRRALTPVEVGMVLQATRASKKVFRHLTGTDRAMLYVVAASTGLRAKELASVRVCDFLIDGVLPAIRVSCRNEKSKRDVEQPLPLVLVEQIARYLLDRQPLEKVWGSSWPEKAWAMVRSDLKEAGIPHKTDEGYFDFHSWRHTYISLLAQSSLQPKMVQDLARHSDIRLTMSRYAHTQKQQRSEAANLLPLFPLQGRGMAGSVTTADNSKVKETAEKAILPTGIEPVTYGLGNLPRASKSPIKQGRCAHCGTIPLAVPLELLRIIGAWAGLDAKVKQAILALAA